MDYTITSKREVNDEGSEFVDLTITFANGEVMNEGFASYFDSPGESATEQAASFVAAFEESQLYSLEERLGPYGLEWEREQEERLW